MRYWTGLQDAGDRAILEQGANAFQEEALTIHNDGSGERGKRMLSLEVLDPILMVTMLWSMLKQGRKQDDRPMPILPHLLMEENTL